MSKYLYEDLYQPNSEPKEELVIYNNVGYGQSCEMSVDELYHYWDAKAEMDELYGEYKDKSIPIDSFQL